MPESFPKIYSRREFIYNLSGLCLGCAIFSGCKDKNEHVVRNKKIPLTQVDRLRFGANYFSLERVVVFKDEKGLSAASMVCTHQECVLRVNEAQRTFTCPCHGSEFDRNGNVLSGPAVKPLPFFELSKDNASIEVDFSKIVDADWRLVVS